MSSLDDQLPVPKVEHSEEEEFDESASEPDDQNNTQEPAQVQKRKGGRKPIYATSEERKQRNRQAQAAFRERRTEYIKQLETTIKHHEEQLQSLQQSHRSAADECLMLRYKNSLLERILLEKGINVQEELKMKADETHAAPHPPSSAQSQPSAVQRAVMNRQGQPRRSMSGPNPKPIRPHQAPSHVPPRLQPTPPSTSRSPTSGSSPHSGKAIPRSSSGDSKIQKHRQHPLEPRQQSHQGPSKLSIPPVVSGMQTMSPSSASGSKGGEIGTAGTQTSFYPSPFQAHIEQLEQEYDAHADMLEDETPSDASLGPGSSYPQHPQHPQQYHQHPLARGQPMPMEMQGQPAIQQMHGMPPMPPPGSAQQVDPNHPAYGSINPGFDPYDSSLDADPFGLTASMHFPTQFTFQESSMRR